MRQLRASVRILGASSGRQRFRISSNRFSVTTNAWRAL
jgi:hypothetical protein